MVVADSTGHGIPGAFMSLLNITFLNEAIKEKGITQPNKVFDYVREKLIYTVSKEEQKDGFDGVILCIDTANKSITYAAANNRFIVIRDGRIIESENDRMPVGKGERKQGFSLFSFQLKTSDMLYAYTDGFADQFGGPKGKKFKYKQLNELLLEVSKLPMNEQKEMLFERFKAWKGDAEQVDDVCVVGIKF